MNPEHDRAADGALPDLSNTGFDALLAHNDVVFALGLALVLATLLIPLPRMIMDMLLSCSIAVAIATLVIVLSARESIEFSTFPSLLLFVTLFRLSLNVASTRLILLHGDAGQIIRTFGHFVAGGNIVVGLVVFLILVVIQFVVITKGAERISEVAARFNLDAMPGKQMAIDADLNAGLIREAEAKARRAKIVKESDFYGAMDGASKFIRGDAVAGLVITGINLVGGFIVGMTGGMSASEAVQAYAILAVGDGLVSQIPAVIISSASGFLVSKASTQASLSQDLVRQMLSRSRPIGIAAFLLGAMVFVPGFPKLPFVVLAVGAGAMAAALRRFQAEAASAAEKPKALPKPDDEQVDKLLEVDRIAILVGPRLIRTVDPRRPGSLSHRIGPLRKKFAQEYGLILPLVRLRDNVTLEPSTYEVRVNNHVLATGRLEPEKLLAMDPGVVQSPLPGQAAQEPVFGLPALWIEPDQKEQALAAGYTVVEPETVLITHLSETLRRNAHELLSRDDVQQLTDMLRERQPALVNGVVGEQVSMGLLHRVLQNLLKDGIGIRDLSTILEAAGDGAPRTKDPALLTELARKSLVRTITEQHADAENRVQAIVLDPALDYELRNSLTRDSDGETLALTPARAAELVRHVAEQWRAAMEAGYDRVVLLCDFRIRLHLALLLSRQVPQLPVLAYDELAPATQIDQVGAVSLREQYEQVGAGT